MDELSELGGSAAIAHSPKRAAVIVDRSESTIRRAIADGELVARKDGTSTVIEHDELLRWVRSLPLRSRNPVTA